MGIMMAMKFCFLEAKNIKTTSASAIRWAQWIVLCVALGACSQASEQELLDRAHIAFEQGDARTAEIDTRTALQQNPDNPVARRLLGEIYLFQQDSAAAVDEFQRSLDAADEVETRVLYARALLAAGRGAQLLEMNSKNEFANVSENPRYLAVLAGAQAGGGQLQNGRDTIAVAIANAPDDPLVATTNAFFLLVYSDRLEEARTALQNIVTMHPDYADAWSLLGGIQQVRSEYAEAEESYEKAVQLNSYRVSDRLNLITVRIDQDKTEEADGPLQRMLSNNPNHPGVNYLHGRMLIEAGQNQEALTAFQKVLNVQPGHIGSLYLSAVANAAEGNFATARDQLNRLLAIQRDHVSGHLLLANVHLLMGNPVEAEQVARSILQDNQMNYPAMGVLATALNAQNKSNDESIALYQRMIEVRPEAVEPRLALGSALLQTGDSAGGLAQTLAAHDLAPGSELTWESLIQAHLASGDLTAAKTEAMAYAEQQPQNPRPKFYLARIALQESDASGANAYFGEAEVLLRQAINDEPDNLVYQGLLIDTLVSQGKLTEAGVMLANLPEEAARNPAVLVARGRIALAESKPAEAEPLLRSALDEAPSTLTLLWLGGAIKAQGRRDDAIDLLNDWVAEYPTDALVHFELASTYMLMGQEKEASEHYQAVVTYGPENVIVLNNLAWLQRKDDPQQALLHIQKADELAPNNPQILDTYAMIQLELGATDDALALNQRAQERMQNEPSLLYNRAVILQAAGQTTEALQILEGIVETDGIASATKQEAQTLMTEIRGQ